MLCTIIVKDLIQVNYALQIYFMSNILTGEVQEMICW